MNLSVKNVKFNRELSQETECFSASIYLDGKKVGTVFNTGCGGCNDYHWSDWETGRKIEEWASTQKTEYEFDKLDQIVWDLCSQYELNQKMKRLCKSKTLFRVKGDPADEWRTLPQAFSPKVKNFIVNKYSNQVEEILNETMGAK